MAIFGIGAFHNNKTDVTKHFLRSGVACVGWKKADAPALHNLLRRVQTGDIVYIKAHPPGRALIVKAVGIVTDNEVKSCKELGHGVNVRWVWSGEKIFPEKADERYNVRNNTLYEELSPVFQAHIVKLMFTRFRK